MYGAPREAAPTALRYSIDRMPGSTRQRSASRSARVPARLRGLLSAVAPTLAFSLILGGGVLIGFCYGTLQPRSEIDGFLDRATLGAFLDAEEKPAYASAYHDPAEAEAGMDDYAWTVPVVPVPYVGNAPAPGRHANAVINVQLLRHPAPLAVPRPDGVVRIFLTGGSTAFGSGAPDLARTIGGYLQALAQADLGPRTGLHYEVVNAANPSWTSSQERLWIQQHLIGLDPDLIVSFSGNNDVHWGLLGRSVRWMRTHGDQHFHRLLALAYRAAGRPLPEVLPAVAGPVPPGDIARDLAANVDLVSHFLGARDVPYVFALQPTLPVTAKELSEREAARRAKFERSRGEEALGHFEDSYAAIAQALREAESEGESDGFAFVDVSGVFDSDRPEVEIFLDSYHFGDRGNERIARALYAELRPRLLALRSSPGSG